MIFIKICILLSVLPLSVAVSANAPSTTVLENGELVFTVSKEDKPIYFKPEFCTVYFETAPKISLDRIDKKGDTDNVNYRTLAWNGEKNFFNACNPVQNETGSVIRSEARTEIHYKPTDAGKLAVMYDTGSGTDYPLITVEYTALKDGFHSVGYCGVPETHYSETDEVWQPLVWTQNRFPGNSYMTPDFLCPLPSVLVNRDGTTFGVVADPSSFPFSPLPTYKRYRFGVLLRNNEGNAQPMIWAPVPGTSESEMKAGDVYVFSFRIVAESRPVMEVQEIMAMGLYGLDTYHRDNSLGTSLNTTLDNMIDYGMGMYSWFIDELKGCSYETDVRNAVKNSTSLNPLNLAVVTDNRDIYYRRFIPMLEYMLSRENLLFSLTEKEGTGQKPSSVLGKPVMNCTEALAIYEATGGKNGFLLNDIAEEKKSSPSDKENEKFWKDRLAYYNATGDIEYLRQAEEGADIYVSEVVDNIQNSFDYRGNSSSSFWTQLSPKFPELYNMYRATGKKYYLEAARYGARRYAQFIWMSPAIPDSMMTVNIGGKAPKQKPWGEPINVPEEKVECWRLSEIGLHCECAATSSSHRGVFMTHHAPYMRKIGEETGDSLLVRISNWALVGRYSNFPGYHINTDRTTVYEKPGFPLRTHYEMNVNSMHYNHIWPLMSIVLDYLVTDVLYKSDGNISFGSIPVEAFANLGSEMYGFSSGKFFGNKVMLWMPSRLAVSDNPQINYISARDDDGLYLAFSNQSEQWQNADIEIDADLVSGIGKSVLKRLDKGEGTCSGKGSVISVSLPPLGFAAVVLKGVTPCVKFQNDFSGKSDTWNRDFLKTEYGRSMIVNVGNLPDRFYTYVYGGPDRYRRAGISYRINGGRWTDILDCVFPFEFSVDLPEDTRSIEYRMVLTDSENKPIYTDTYKLYK